MKRPARALAVVGATVVGVGGLVASPPGAGADAGDPLSIRVVIDGRPTFSPSPGVTVRQSVTASGLVRVTATTADGSVSGSGFPGDVLAATIDRDPKARGEHSAGASSESAPVDLSRVPEKYRRFLLSPVFKAVAAGMPYDQAVETFGPMAPELTPTQEEIKEALAPASQPAGKQGVLAVSGSQQGVRKWKKGDIYQADCVTQKGTKVDYRSYGCRTIKWYGLQGGKWYYGVTTQITGRVKDGMNRMTGLRHYVSWADGNKYVEWSPSKTRKYGDCGPVELSASSGPASISYAAEMCPRRLEPFLGMPKSYGSKWSGVSGDYMDAISAAVVQHTAGRSMTNKGFSYIWWSN